MDDKNEAFKKRAGTTSRGKDYEDLIVAHLALKLLSHNYFELSSNNEQFGAFDDVILELEDTRVYAIQLKHSNKDRYLTKRALTESRGNYSLKKYYDEYKKLSFDNRTKCVLFTNLKFEDDGCEIELSDNVWVKIIKIEPDPLLNTSEDGCCYIFETDDVEYYEFFKNFFLYTNQVNVDVLKMKIMEQFDDKQSFKEYIDFVTEWSIKEGKKPKLDKTTMARVLTLCVLSENIVPFSFEDSVDQNTKLLRNAMSGFGITVIKPHNLRIVKRVYSDGDKELTDIDIVNRVAAKYQVISKRVSDISDLGDLEKTKLLWLLGKFPLIVTKEPMCDSGKFIVLSEETTKGEFQTLSDLDSTSSIYREILDNFHISIQGKRTPLRTLIEESDNFRAIITLDELLEMTGTFSIGDKSEELPVPYIDRLISVNTIDPKFLVDIKNDTLVVINGHFVHIRKEIEDLELEEQVIYITDKDQFENVCKRHPRRRNYHYFKAIGEKLEWVQSLGDIQELDKYLLCGDFIPESEFSSLGERKVEVVCAEPGMGKSILMKSVKNRQPTWTILIHPKEHASSLTTNTFIEYIIDLTKRRQGSFQSKFLDILIKQRKVTFIWDGLDEVPPEYQDAVIVLIKDLQEKGFYQFVSARNHLRKKLESELNTLARTIKPIDREEQAAYIKKRLGLSENDDVIRKIIDNVEMIRCHDILEVPLHIYMLTELLLRNWDKYKEIVLQDIFPITDLYSYFIDEKFNIYYHEKVQLDDTEDLAKRLIQTTKRDRLENYGRVALNLVFKDSRNIYSSFLEEIRDNSDCCGIITSVSTEGVPTFIHQSFGEYFVAKYLVKSVDIELLFTEEFTNIRFFFDLLLARNHPVHLAVLYKNLKVLPNYLDNFQDVDDGGRSPLHLACSWGLKFYTVKKKSTFDNEEIDMLWSQKETFENRQIVQFFCGNCDPYQLDDVFKMDAFSYANKSSSLFPMLTLARIYQRNVKDFDNFKDVGCVLFQSAKLGYTEIFDVPDLSKIIGDNLHSLLVSAVEWNSPSILKRLLYGKDYKFRFGKDDKSYPVIGLACRKGNIEIIRLLSQANVDLNTLLYSHGIPPLVLVCQFGHLEAVKIFIDEYKFDINCQDSSGNTPILAACAGGHFDIVKFLMERKVNYNHLNKMGTGVLTYATSSGKVEIVTYFLELGVDAHLTNKEGLTALHMAAVDVHLEIAQILIRNGAKIDAATKNGLTPLHLASDRGKTQLVGLLLDNTASPDLQDDEGHTPLYLASFSGHVEAVRLLIAARARVDIAKRNGRTPLYVASEKGHSDVVKVLVAAGADVDCRNQQKSTPLHVACENRHVEVVKVLLELGADVSARNFFGRTAEQTARSKGFLEIVELFSKHTNKM